MGWPDYRDAKICKGAWAYELLDRIKKGALELAGNDRKSPWLRVWAEAQLCLENDAIDHAHEGEPEEVLHDLLASVCDALDEVGKKRVEPCLAALEHGSIRGKSSGREPPPEAEKTEAAIGWPKDRLLRPIEMLDEIIAFARMQPPPPVPEKDRWAHVLAAAIKCRGNDPHGQHAGTRGEDRMWQVARAWAEIHRKGENADVFFVLSEMNHGNY